MAFKRKINYKTTKSLWKFQIREIFPRNVDIIKYFQVSVLGRIKLVCPNVSRTVLIYTSFNLGIFKMN